MLPSPSILLSRLALSFSKEPWKGCWIQNLILELLATCTREHVDNGFNPSIEEILEIGYLPKLKIEKKHSHVSETTTKRCIHSGYSQKVISQS